MVYSKDIQEQLLKVFGFSSLRKGQEAVIKTLLQGHSAGAIFPTGSGKSLCYQLPAVMLPHLTLVVSPLLALIKDQMDFLQSKNIACARIDSTLSKDEAYQVKEDLKNEKIKILFISVERFKNERFRNFLHSLKLSLLVVDEAHCISEWGHNFRPDYLKLPSYKEEFKIPQVLLLTATASPKVVEDMRTKFDISVENIIATGFYRPNLHIEVIPTLQVDKEKKIVELLRDTSDKPTIIYVTLQKSAEELADLLKAYGVNVEAYHAGLKSEVRTAIQQRFMNDKSSCIVATIAFGMGIDKGNIRQVIHYDLPKSIENYSQEIGRAGRDGGGSDCIVLANTDNVHVLQNFVYGDTPQESEIRNVLEQIKEAGEEWKVKIYQLTKETNVRMLPLKTLMVYLESSGIIQPSASFYSEYRMKLKQSVDQIVSRFKGERQEFIKSIFQFVAHARVWSTLDLEALVTDIPDRSRAIKAFEYLEQVGLLELEAKSMVEVYRVLDKNFSVEEVGAKMHSIFMTKEQNEIARIQEMLNLLESNTCISKRLSVYFGEKTEWESCGHCSVCLSGGIQLPEVSYKIDLDHQQFVMIYNDLQQMLGKSPSAITLSRFFCGIVEPCFFRTKAKQLYGFGLLGTVDYAIVRNWVKNQLDLQ